MLDSNEVKAGGVDHSATAVADQKDVFASEKAVADSSVRDAESEAYRPPFQFEWERYSSRPLRWIHRDNFIRNLAGTHRFKARCFIAVLAINILGIIHVAHTESISAVKKSFSTSAIYESYKFFGGGKFKPSADVIKKNVDSAMEVPGQELSTSREAAIFLKSYLNALNNGKKVSGACGGIITSGLELLDAKGKAASPVCYESKTGDVIWFRSLVNSCKFGDAPLMVPLKISNVLPQSASEPVICNQKMMWFGALKKVGDVWIYVDVNFDRASAQNSYGLLGNAPVSDFLYGKHISASPINQFNFDFGV